MALLDQINSELITAIKANDTLARDTLRLLKTAIKNNSINQGRELNDEEIIEVLTKEVKQRQESITVFQAADRAALADKEKAELTIIQRYLPEPISDEQLKRLVGQAISATGATTRADMGKVMAKLRPLTKGRADGSRVSRLVSERLSSI